MIFAITTNSGIYQSAKDKMSRNCLRRQLFQKHYDHYSHPDTHLDTVIEEEYDRNPDKHELVTDLDATYLDDVRNVDQNWNQERDSIILNSPIVRPKRTTHHRHSVEILASPETDISLDEDSIYVEPWDKIVPAPPDDSHRPQQHEVAKPNKPKQKVSPLFIQQPSHSTPSRSDQNLPFSPIHRSTVRSSSCKGIIRTRRHSGTFGERVRALPMSPALIVAPSTSTPGPHNVDINTPSCHSIMEQHDNIFNFSECNMCRICHEDGGKEKLVSPCHCAGTMGMLHLSCLGKWLGSSKTTKCEICDFQFIVKKKSHPFRWYLKEPSLGDDRRLMIKDISLTICSGFLVIVISILCMVFSLQFKTQHKPGPASVLVLVALCSVMLFIAWTCEAVKRMRKRYLRWYREHHVIEIEQQDDSNGKMEHTPPQRFSVRLPKKSVSIPKTKPTNNLLSSKYMSYSLESYKAAMFNPITPDEPLLQDMNNNDLTNLHESSPSVISLDELMEECVSYYQPPTCGTTSVLNTETGPLLKETGV